MRITRAIIVRDWQLVQPGAVPSRWHRCKSMRSSLFAFQVGNVSPRPWCWFCMVSNLAALLLSLFHHCLSRVQWKSVLLWLEAATLQCVGSMISHFFTALTSTVGAVEMWESCWSSSKWMLLTYMPKRQCQSPLGYLQPTGVEIVMLTGFGDVTL